MSVFSSFYVWYLIFSSYRWLVINSNTYETTVYVKSLFIDTGVVKTVANISLPLTV